MTTSSPEILSSVIREAGRQADFYDARGKTELCQWWSELEGLAMDARRARHGLTIRVDQSTNPLPIKPCE